MQDESPVRLMHYDPRWRQEFEQTRSGILQSCVGWVTAVEHIGSTAVSGLIARPIIDLIAGVESAESIAPAVLSMQGLNYREVTSPDWAATAITLEKPRHGDPTHRVFLMRRDCDAWRRALRIRDWLRQHAEIAIRFEQAKVGRWQQGEGDPVQYDSDKSIYFAHLEEQLSAESN